jgi:hypothetical protein
MQVWFFPQAGEEREFGNKKIFVKF